MPSITAPRRLVPRRRWRLTAALALVCAPIALAPVGQAAIIPSDVSVRVYDNTGLPDQIRRAGLDMASDIFERAEVEIGWVHCPARCGRVLGPHQLVLRLTRSPSTAAGVGSSVIDPILQAGRLATVYVDQVDSMARRSNTDRVTVLSRAIAHEIGHLILGSAEHTRTGLMRGVWTMDELRRNWLDDWQFTPVQRTLMRVRIVTGNPFRWNVGVPPPGPVRPGS